MNRLTRLIALAREAERLAPRVERGIGLQPKGEIDYNEQRSESTRPEAR